MSELEGEQRTAIVQHEAAALDRDAGAEQPEIALDQRHHVAVAIDGREIGGVGARIGRLAGADAAVRMGGIDELRAFAAIVRRNHPRNRHLGKAGIGDISQHIGIGELLRLDLEVQCLDRIVSPLVDRGGAHDVEHHERCDALLVGRQFIDRPAAVVGRDRIDPFRGEVGEVVRGHGAAEPRRGRKNALRDRALVEGVAAVLGDRGERGREIGIAEDFADLGSATPRQENPRRLGVAEEIVGAVAPIFAEQLADREPRLGMRDRRSEHIGKALGTEAAQQRIPAGDRARHSRGMDARVRHVAGAVGDEECGGERLRRPAGGVEAVDLLRLGVIDDGEQVAADAAHHRRHQTHGGVGRDRGVDRIAAALQHGGTGARRDRMLRRDDPVLRDHHGAGLRAVLRHRRRRRDHERAGQRKSPCVHEYSS